MQVLTVIFLFILAAGYIAYLVFQHFKSSSSCPKGCSSCSAIDIEDIQKKIEEQALKANT